MKKLNNLFMMKMMSLFGGLIFYAPVALLVRTRYGITYSQFFILQAILSFSIFIFEVPCGILTDKLGYKKTIVLSNVFMFLARLLMLLSNNFILFCIESIIEGVSFAFNSGTLSSYIYSVDEDKFAENLSSVSNYSNIGFIISTLGFPIINLAIGINGLLVFTVIFSFISLLFSFKLERIKIKKDTYNDLKFKRSKKYNLGIIDLIIIAFTTLINVAFILINFFYVSILIDFNVSENYMTLVILMYTGIELLIPYIIQKLGENDVWNKMKIILFINIIIIVTISKLKNIFIFVPMIIFPSVLSILNVYLSKYQNIYIDNLDENENRATILSFYSMLSNFVGIIFLFISSKISDFGIYNIFFMLGIIFVLLLFIIYIFEKRKKLNLVRQK